MKLRNFLISPHTRVRIPPRLDTTSSSQQRVVARHATIPSQKSTWPFCLADLIICTTTCHISTYVASCFFSLKKKTEIPGSPFWVSGYIDLLWDGDELDQLSGYYYDVSALHLSYGLSLRLYRICTLHVPCHFCSRAMHVHVVLIRTKVTMGLRIGISYILP